MLLYKRSSVLLYSSKVGKSAGEFFGSTSYISPISNEIIPLRTIHLPENIDYPLFIIFVCLC